MQVICEHATTCNASMYCVHARPHEPINPWKRGLVERKCDNNHECDYAKEMVKCEEKK